ncbi:hypothetical protein EG327_003935 [Venturia inaequalis]|uniref:Uncharacterized protein n=1 Tax=Venturia inaequalis TaxID=5025 RepID=A0A8H3ZJ10_VENIN|nr:hypothetical protein EG327_003935 [Venturia inaequalis]
MQPKTEYFSEDDINFNDEGEGNSLALNLKTSPPRTPVQRTKWSKSPEPVLPHEARPRPPNSNSTATPWTLRLTAPETGTRESLKIPADWQDGQFDAHLAFPQCIPKFDKGRYPTKPEWEKICKNCGLPLGPGHTSSFTCNKLCFICEFRNRPGAHVANCHQGKPCDSHRHAEGLYRKYAKNEKGYNKDCYPSEPPQSRAPQREREASPRRGGRAKRASSKKEPRQTHINEPPRGRESSRRGRDPSPPRHGESTHRPDSSKGGHGRQQGSSKGGRPQKVTMDKDVADRLLNNSRKRERDSHDDEDRWDWLATTIQGAELFKNKKTGDISLGNPSNLPYFKKMNFGGPSDR